MVQKYTTYCKMQTLCKAVRKQAVCGSKPGGSGAYNLRESCVKKDAPARPPKSPKETPEAKELKKIKKGLHNLMKLYLKELKELKARDAQIANSSKALPVNFESGNDHDMTTIYVDSAQRLHASSVHSRIKKACAEFNMGRRNPVGFNHALERLVISGAAAHFQSAFIELAQEIRRV